MIEAAFALQWLAENPACELSYRYDDEEDFAGWQVHRVSGGVNDREWTLIGSGGTPLAALIDAIKGLASQKA